MGPRHLSSLLLLCLLTPASVLAAEGDGGGPKLGFTERSVGAQRRGEEAFLAVPTPSGARNWLQRLTEEPHVAGTAGGRRVAELIRDRLQEFGFEVELVRYDVLLNHPVRASLRLVEPKEQELSLNEQGNLRDKDSFSADVFPGFHGYGASGVAEAQVVYANYGTQADFRKLQELGIDVEGRVVLARYGQVFRGLKVREAQDRGAVGVILFSDPEDDGYMQGEVWPDGPMRPPHAIQRGSVQFLSEGPGDPQTPGYASTGDAKRVPREELTVIPRIPSIPIGYGEAKKILLTLSGPRVPDDWQGGLPFAYHLGPGPAKVRLEVEMDYAVRPIYNPVGRIRGAVEPDRWIVVGNHHDAWTYGAVDPSSGTASFLETARGIGAAVQAGWVPRRTIVFASWDAEEYGLVGSTEWGEDLAAELGEKAVAYINLDVSVTGRDLSASGIPSLRDLMVEAAGDLEDPVKGRSVGDLWADRRRERWSNEAPVILGEPDAAFRLALDPLGSGSDYTVFVDHLGIASLNFSFRGKYGVYHSALDSFFWMEKFGDPEFLYHAVASKLLGLLTMRLAGADVVPMRYTPYAEALEDQLDDLRRTSVRKVRGRRVNPETGRAPLAVSFDPVLVELAAFRVAAEKLDGALDGLASGELPEGKKLARLNDAVVRVERELLSPEGLPGRPWFRHMLYAPGLTTGYASWPFPGLNQAILDQDPDMWDRQLRRIVGRLQAATQALERAAAAAGA